MIEKLSRSGMAKLVFSAICMLVLLPGCGPSTKEKLRQKGYDLSSSNKYCDAYYHYREMQTSPETANDPELPGLIEDASRDCVKQIIRSSQKQISGNKFELAIADLKKAKQINPKNKSVTVLLNDANSRFAEFKKALAEHESKATAFMEQKEWQKALQELQMGLSLSPNHQKMAAMRVAINDELKRAESLIAEAQACINNKDWRKAIETYEVVLTILPANRGAEEGISNAREQLVKADAAVAFGVQQTTSGQHNAAEKTFQTALSIDPASPGAKEGLAVLYRKIAGGFEEKGNIGIAIHYFNSSLAFQPDAPGVKERINALESAIFQRIECTVALVPLKEFQKDPEFSDRLSKELFSQLTGKDRGYIKVIDHRKLDTALNDSGLSIESLADTKKLDKLKGIKDIQAVIAGKVASFKIRADKNRERLSKKYQSGTTRRRNPDYDEALSDLRNAETRAEAVRRAADQAGGGWAGMLAKVASGAVGGADVGSARAKLAQTPEYVDDPVYDNWSYYRVHHTKNGDAQVALRLIDTETAAVLLEENLQATVSQNYETIDNPNPSIGIVDKPVPDNIEDNIKTDSIKQIVVKFEERFNTFVAKYAFKYLQKAEALSQRNMKLEAAEEYANFQYAVRQSSEFSAEKTKATDFLKSLALPDSKPM